MPDTTLTHKTTAWGVIRAIMAGVSISAIAGAVYGYGVLNQRVVTAEAAVKSAAEDVRRVEKSQEEAVRALDAQLAELRVTLREVSTDLKWIKRQMRGGEP